MINYQTKFSIYIFIKTYQLDNNLIFLNIYS